MLDDFRPRRPAKPTTLEPTLPQPTVVTPTQSSEPTVIPDTNAVEHPVVEPPAETPHNYPFAELHQESVAPAAESTLDKTDTAPVKKTFILLRPFSKLHKPTKKQAIIIGAVVVLIGAAGTAYALTRPEPVPAVKKTAAAKVITPVPKPIISPLTGLEVTAEQQAQPVTGVMIENSPDARPQSGLKEAGIVYEAIAEGGITRFLALYQEAAPGNVGPIRSARPYYLDWLMPFEASLAHVGGSPDALALIKSLGVRDLDQFANAGAYHRVNTRYAPHNVYTSIQTLSDLGKAKGYTKSTFTSFDRKVDNPYKAPAAVPAGSTAKPADTRTSAKSIDITISSALYNVHYDYKADTNTYGRSEGGTPHLDAESKAQLDPKVVVALVMSYGLMADGKHSAYGTTGTGSMFVFQDGTVTQGTWTKPDNKTQFKFTDASGAPLKFNAGQTWFSVVSDVSKVTSTP